MALVDIGNEPQVNRCRGRKVSAGFHHSTLSDFDEGGKVVFFASGRIRFCRFSLMPFVLVNDSKRRGAMTTQDTTRRVVEAYFAAWTANKVDEAYALLAENLEFSGPTTGYRSANEFHPALVNFAGMTKSARIAELLVQGDRAAMLYDCELPPPVGMLRIASFFRVENGKIRWYETLFDATELRKLVASKREGQ
jgi:hypothetical protein